MSRKMYVEGVAYQYSTEGITIFDSYKIDYRDVWDLCYKLEKAIPFVYKRTADSWAKEILAHNLLYKLKLFRSRTQDTDIEDNESKLRLAGYSILYHLFNIYVFFVA